MPTAPRPRPLVFIHVPRTGGTTLYQLLAPLFDSRRVYPWSQRIGGFAKEYLEAFDFFGGHYSAADVEASHLRDSLVMTFLRQPVARVCSLYVYWRAHKPEVIERTGNHYMLAAHRLAFDEFLNSDDGTVRINIRNGMTALFGRTDYGSGYRDVTEADYQRACACLERMWFVGLHEFFDDSVQVLRGLLALPKLDIIPTLNSAVGLHEQADFRAVETPEIPPALESMAGRLNAFDLRLYEHATRLFAAQRDRPPAPFVPLPIRRPSVFRHARVQFGKGEAGNDLLAAGWSHPEKGFVWSERHSALLLFQTRAPLPPGVILSLELCPFINTRHPSLLVNIALNGQPLLRALFAINDSRVAVDGSAVVFATAADRLLTVQARLPELAEGEHALAFEFHVPASPAELGVSTDSRLLGIALSALEID